MATRYEETSTAWWVWLLYGAAVLFAAVATWIFLAMDDTGGEQSTAKWIVIGVHAFGAPMLVLLARVFSGYRVVFDGEQLTFGFRLWNRSIAVGEIRAAKPDRVSLWTFFGAGWRIGRDGRIGYINTFGSAVEVKADRHTYCFSCADPASLVQKLREGGVSPDPS